MHLIGCTFYAIFASGELQPWAEPPNEEQKVWTPTTGAGLGSGAYMKETTFVSIWRFCEDFLYLIYNPFNYLERTGYDTTKGYKRDDQLRSYHPARGQQSLCVRGGTGAATTTRQLYARQYRGQVLLNAGEEY